jgi:hypothetical protein
LSEGSGAFTWVTSRINRKDQLGGISLILHLTRDNFRPIHRFDYCLWPDQRQAYHCEIKSKPSTNRGGGTGHKNQQRNTHAGTAQAMLPRNPEPGSVSQRAASSRERAQRPTKKKLRNHGTRTGARASPRPFLPDDPVLRARHRPEEGPDARSGAAVRMCGTEGFSSWAFSRAAWAHGMCVLKDHSRTSGRQGGCSLDRLLDEDILFWYESYVEG